MNKEKELNEILIDVCLKIAKRNEGGMIVFGDCKYDLLAEQTVPNFDVRANTKLLESLILMDGAVVISKNGILKAYGAMIKKRNISLLKNFGTRHNSAISASMEENNIVYVISEEDNKVRIFKKGKLILEIDGKAKNIEKKVSEINDLMESVGYGTLGAIAGAAIAPVIGIVAISGVTIFVVTTGVTYVIKKLRQMGWTI